jgi:hypothetical protein
MARGISSANKWVAITPHNTNPIAGGPPTAIVCSGAGTVTLVDQFGNEMVRTLVAEQIYPFMPSIIKLTGTTATGITGLYN